MKPRNPGKQEKRSNMAGTGYGPGSPSSAVANLTPQVQATKMPTQPGQMTQPPTAAPTMPKVAMVRFVAFADEFEKIARVKPPFMSRVKEFVNEGMQKGFIFDKGHIKDVRKRHGSVRAYMKSPESRLPHER